MKIRISKYSQGLDVSNLLKLDSYEISVFCSFRVSFDPAFGVYETPTTDKTNKQTLLFLNSFDIWLAWIS